MSGGGKMAALPCGKRMQHMSAQAAGRTLVTRSSVDQGQKKAQ